MYIKVDINKQKFNYIFENRSLDIDQIISDTTPLNNKIIKRKINNQKGSIQISIESGDKITSPKVVTDQLKTDLTRAEQIFGAYKNEKFSKNRRKTANPYSRLVMKNAKMIQNISINDNNQQTAQDSILMKSINAYAENKESFNDPCLVKPYSQMDKASRMLKRRLLKSASVQKSSFINNMSHEGIFQLNIL